MLTVKIMLERVEDVPDAPGGPTTLKRFSTFIVEATEVAVHTLRSQELMEVAITHPPGGPNAYSAYYIANRNRPKPEGFAKEVDFYYAAYVENAAGKTVDRVTFD